MLNFGLNCYMNSLLQCILNIPQFRNYFIKEKNNFRENQIVCKALSDVMLGLKNKNEEYYAAFEFKKIMGNKNNLFYGVNAGDAKDLYFNLIDLILNELLIKKDKDNLISDNKNGFQLKDLDKEKMFQEIKKEIDENNIINNLFVGYYDTSYNCINLPKDFNIFSFNTEAFILFNLETINNYYNNNQLNIEDCFEYNYGRRYKTSFYCNICQNFENNIAEEKIYRPSKILCIILDRGRGKSFKGKVIFDYYLDLQNYIDEENYHYNSKYKLISVLSHYGPSSSNGHYVAFCLADNGKYYYFSDEVAKEIDNPLKYDIGDPYILFYERNEK